MKLTPQQIEGAKAMSFNQDMVRAIMDGRKTQTRRPIKNLPGEWLYSGLNDKGSHLFVTADWLETEKDVLDCTAIRKVPYKVGDIIWVRETFKGVWRPQNTPGWFTYVVTYKADGAEVRYRETFLDTVDNWPDKWRPSIHMPKKFSRISLKINKVWVERVRDISTEDIYAEGLCHDDGTERRPMREKFKDLWESIYPGSWDKNGWNECFEFERCET